MITTSLTSALRSALTAFALVAGTFAAFAASSDSTAPGATVSTDKVVVGYRNPSGFTEMHRDFGNRRDWLDDLSSYVAQRAARTVPDGERLLVTITDVQLAGMIHPWSNISTDLRVVTDTTPPRIDLNFQLVAPNGAVLKEGMRQLRDISFLRRNNGRSTEPLSYEKNLIDDWLRKDLPPAKR